jgi:hypothetical protein
VSLIGFDDNDYILSFKEIEYPSFNKVYDYWIMIVVNYGRKNMGYIAIENLKG